MPSTSHPSPSWVRRRLLSWFAKNARDLPWRRSRDPYAIWVSEIMLQQTQVASVVPYFEAFLRAFPDIAALARADEQCVLRLWEGLGYYRRARHLHQAARLIMERHGGVFPADPAQVQKLPGLGRYTVGAVLSQAFDQRLPIVEANSRRVLCRLLGLQAPPVQVESQLWQEAETFLPARRVGDFNQALMELGALICTPAHPDCQRCPLHRHCAARQRGLQDVIPVPAKKPAVVAIDEVAVVVHRGPHLLLMQRPERGRWANLWEFPHGPLEAGECHAQAAHRLLRALAGLRATVVADVATVRHAVTHHRITMTCLAARYQAGRVRSDFYQQGLWLPVERLKAFPVSAPQRRLMERLRQAAVVRC